VAASSWLKYLKTKSNQNFGMIWNHRTEKTIPNVKP